MQFHWITPLFLLFVSWYASFFLYRFCLCQKIFLLLESIVHLDLYKIWFNRLHPARCFWWQEIAEVDKKLWKRKESWYLAWKKGGQIAGRGKQYFKTEILLRWNLLNQLFSLRLLQFGYFTSNKHWLKNLLRLTTRIIFIL